MLLQTKGHHQMDNVVEFPDRPENVEALRSMVAAVRACKEVGFDREKFVKAAGMVFDGVTNADADEQWTQRCGEM